MLTPPSNLEASAASCHSISRDGERRQLTAVFYDIVDSTNLLMHCDPEVLRDVQRRVHEAAYSIFQSNGGSIDHIAGDGGCGYFGVPLPVENGATGAVSAALEL